MYNEDDEDYGEDALETAIMRYNPDKIIRLLELFIDEKQKNTGDLNEDQKKKKKIEKEKKEKMLLKEKKFWDRLTKVLPEERTLMWGVNQIFLICRFLIKSAANITSCFWTDRS